MTAPVTEQAAAARCERVLQAARCTRCGGHSFPAHVPGCRHCGATRGELEEVDCMGAVRLRNFVTVHAPLAPGLEVPCVIGEVALCPGVVEEVLLDVANEDRLTLGMAISPAWSETTAGGGWVFRPCDVEAVR
ncbi:hypothetical protein AB4Z46_07660 [Variovorax sp. M-6]|uniref:hypothetical protein n=1 Tax=Variovorax sp. M-6 TaxID=3233041 RepID=UPI003F9DAB12